MIVENDEPGQIPDDSAGFLLRECPVDLRDMFQKRSPEHLLEHQVEPLRLLIILQQLQDVVLSLAQVEDLNLFQDTGPRRSRGKTKQKQTSK